jgi:hypothetical protein
VKTLHPCVLRRLSWLNVDQLDLPLHTPRQKMPVWSRIPLQIVYSNALCKSERF